ncbi:MAG: hypothetical protein E6Q83_09265 [Thiothrix sp.]|nr:MAG: hypothetical protein E6Q83_09265 [Thiothrix sp.]
MAKNHVCFNCRKVARAPTFIVVHCPQCREAMLCVGLVQPPPAKRIKDWQRWQESIISSQNRCAISSARFQQKQKAKQRYYTEIVANRDLDTLASRRRFRRASKAYDHLVVK